jgi:hypothetical protein
MRSFVAAITLAGIPWERRMDATERALIAIIIAGLISLLVFVPLLMML